ncbi:hypothetical protein [Turicibacter sanguinis]|uniref:hypothetical protein n=1 Tax=Turicibacter sanguinis TaxID=154288 RepID=UPI00241C6EA6|nr:hypothetical protein [Turicibacter sanguinis]
MKLKSGRLEFLKQHENSMFYKLYLKDKEDIDNLFAIGNFDYVINLFAQLEVCYSLINHYAYLDSNLNGL